MIEKRIPPLWENRPEDFPLAGEVLGLATGPDRPLPLRPRPGPRGRLRRADLGRPASRPSRSPTWRRPASAGSRSSPPSATSTRASACRSCSRRSPASGSDIEASRLLLVGATSPGFDLDRRLQRLGLDGAGLVREGYVDERRLWELMIAADVHVSLRSPTMGETSGTAIRALSLGRPLIVSDVGWFSELPDDVALKVPVDEQEVDTLAAALELLATRPDVRAGDGSGGARPRAPRARPRAGRRAVRLGVRAGGRAAARSATRCCGR